MSWNFRSSLGKGIRIFMVARFTPIFFFSLLFTVCKVKSHKLCALRASKDCKWNTLSITDDLLLPADEIVSTRYASFVSLSVITRSGRKTDQERRPFPQAQNSISLKEWTPSTRPHTHTHFHPLLVPRIGAGKAGLGLIWGLYLTKVLHSIVKLFGWRFVPYITNFSLFSLFFPFSKSCLISG